MENIALHLQEGREIGAQLAERTAAALEDEIASGQVDGCDLFALLNRFGREGELITRAGYIRRTEEGATLLECSAFQDGARRAYLHLIKTFFAGSIDHWQALAGGRDPAAFAGLRVQLDFVVVAIVFPDTIRRAHRVRVRHQAAALFHRVSVAAGMVSGKPRPV